MNSFQVASPLRMLRASDPVTPDAQPLRAGFANEKENVTPGRLEPEHQPSLSGIEHSSDDINVGSAPIDSQVWGQTVTFLSAATPPRPADGVQRQRKHNAKDSRASTEFWSLKGCETPVGPLRGSREAVGESFLDELTRGNEGGLWQSPVRTREELDDAFKITLSPSRIPCPCPSSPTTRPRDDFWDDTLCSPLETISCADPIPSADSIFDSPPITPLRLSSEMEPNVLHAKQSAPQRETPMLNWMSKVKHGLDTIGMKMSHKTDRNMKTLAEMKTNESNHALKIKPDLRSNQIATHLLSSSQIELETWRAESSSATTNRGLWTDFAETPPRAFKKQVKASLHKPPSSTSRNCASNTVAQHQSQKGPCFKPRACFKSPARGGTIFEDAPTTPDSYTLEKRQAEHEDDFNTPRGRQNRLPQSPPMSSKESNSSPNQLRLSPHHGVDFGKNQTPSRHDLVLESPIRPPSVSSVPSTRRSLSSTISRYHPDSNIRHQDENGAASASVSASAAAGAACRKESTTGAKLQVPLKVVAKENKYDGKELQLLEKHVGTNPDYVEEWLACKAQAAFLAYDFEALLQHQNYTRITPDSEEEGGGGAEVVTDGHSERPLNKRAKGLFGFDAKRKWNQVINSIAVSTRSLSGYAKKKFSEDSCQHSKGSKSSSANLEIASSTTKKGNYVGGQPTSNFARYIPNAAAGDEEDQVDIKGGKKSTLVTETAGHRTNYPTKMSPSYSSPVRTVVLTKPVSIELDGIKVLSSLEPGIFEEGEQIIEIGGEFVSNEKSAVDLLFGTGYPVEIKVIPAASNFSDV